MEPWRAQYAGMKGEDIKRLKEWSENKRLKNIWPTDLDKAC